jgi:anti-anti-sigma factor
MIGGSMERTQDVVEEQRPTDFSMRVEHEEAGIRVRVGGALDLESARGLREQLTPLFTEGQKLVVDLRNTDYVDSAGVRALLEIQEELERLRGALHVRTCPGSRADRTFALLQLEDRFNMRR